MQELRSILVEVGGFAPDFPSTADFYSDLGMASVEAMRLLVTLEERFQVSIPDEEFIESTTLDRLAGMLGSLGAKSL